MNAEQERRVARVLVENTIERNIKVSSRIRRGLAVLGLGIGLLAGANAHSRDAAESDNKSLVGLVGVGATTIASLVSKKRSNTLNEDLVYAYRRFAGTESMPFQQTKIKIEDGELIENEEFDWSVTRSFDDSSSVAWASFPPLGNGIGGFILGANHIAHATNPEASLPTDIFGGFMITVGTVGLIDTLPSFREEQMEGFRNQLDNIDGGLSFIDIDPQE
jgi:hypothetical protein